MKYGGCRAVDKAVAFLWALHLIAGIDYDDLCWTTGIISSLTTDHDTEIGLVDVPDILRSWLRRLGGTPMDDLAGTIDFSTRLFKYATRIPGWSHMWANIMKYACNRLENWPVILNCLRAISGIFRNQTWMHTIADAIEDRHEGAQEELKYFKGSLAKWRYETVWLLIKECLRVRHICWSF